MKVKNLIMELLNYPMDAEVITCMRDKEESYHYGNGCNIVDYEDGTIAILSKEERKED